MQLLTLDVEIVIEIRGIPNPLEVIMQYFSSAYNRKHNHDIFIYFNLMCGILDSLANCMK